MTAFVISNSVYVPTLWNPLKTIFLYGEGNLYTVTNP